MKKTITALLILAAASLFSQEHKLSVVEQLKSPKGKIFFNVGTEYRITPIYRLASLATFIPADGNAVITNIDLQNSGPALFYSLDYFATNHLNLFFEHTFRYDLLMYNDDTSFNHGSRPATNALFMDFLLGVEYYVNVSKKSQLYIRTGISRNNTGSNYSTLRTYYAPDGTTILAHGISQYDFAYFATHLGLGYKRDRLNLSMGIMTSVNTPYFRDQTRFTIPYIRLGYCISKL